MEYQLRHAASVHLTLCGHLKNGAHRTLTAVVQPSRYLLLFTSKGSLFFVCGAGIVLAYFLLREDRASGPRN